MGKEGEAEGVWRMSSKAATGVAPLRDVEALGDGSFHATGVEPQLALMSPRAPRRGWALVHMHLMARPGVELEPHLHFDCGAGFEESASTALPAPGANGVVCAVLRLPEGVRGLRLDVAHTAVDFALSDVSVRHLSPAEAMTRLGWRRFAEVRGRPRALWLNVRNAVRILGREGWSGIAERMRKHERSLAADRSYAEWVRRFDTLGDADFAAMRVRIEGMARKPVISVLMPVYNVEPRWLEQAVRSVREQVYPHWELCIADDASTRPGVRELLAKLARDDARIKLCLRERNGHISAASNSALDLATGEYVALLDHDDELAPHALYLVAEEVNAHPDAGLIYSDEDKIDEQGRRFEPYFKCDWNYDLFCSHNMVSHLGVYRRELVREVGGFRQGYEGSQDYDLALRVSERLGRGAIRHIPHVLYHWRSIPGSTALGATEKSYARDAAQRSIEDHLARRRVHAAVLPAWEGSQYHRVKYAVAEPAPRVTLVIPTRDRVDLLRRCVGSILEKTAYPNYEILIVDNGSREPATLAYLREIAGEGASGAASASAPGPRVRVMPYAAPFNFAAINNEAARAARGEIIGFVNNDIEVMGSDWLAELVSHACRPGIGMVGAKLYYPDDTIQHAGIITGVHRIAGHVYRGRPRFSPGYFSRAKLIQALSAVTAACCLVRQAVFEEVGGFDEQLAIAFNDVDLCLRLREHGYTNVWTPYAELYHHESASRGPDHTRATSARFAREIAFMEERWGEALAWDPAYSPSLSLEDDNCALAFLPRAPKPWGR